MTPMSIIEQALDTIPTKLFGSVSDSPADHLDWI